jgi:hypothetical protein
MSPFSGSWHWLAGAAMAFAKVSKPLLPGPRLGADIKAWVMSVISTMLKLEIHQGETEQRKGLLGKCS